MTKHKKINMSASHNKRIIELEDKAIELFLKKSDWEYVTSHLTMRENVEYWRLVKNNTKQKNGRPYRLLEQYWSDKDD